MVHETKFSLKISYLTHACLVQLDQRQTCKPVMVSVVSSSPTEANFIFLRHLDANFAQKWKKCQICIIYENLVYLHQNSSEGIWSVVVVKLVTLPMLFIWALKACSRGVTATAIN